jgi:hypothetical protein
LTDAQLEAKFLDQAILSLPLDQARRALDLCWQIDSLANVADLVNAAIPA